MNFTEMVTEVAARGFDDMNDGTRLQRYVNDAIWPVWEDPEVNRPGDACDAPGHGTEGEASMQKQGTCECGCGADTTPGRRFVWGHNRKISGLEYVVVEATGCWEWQLACSGGYGKIGRRGAHRVYYERFVGPIPKGHELDHLCRNTLCVNPEHLEPVLGIENVRRGKAAKLSPNDVRAIRASPLRPPALAAQYGCTLQNIHLILKRVNWRDI
jgi:hypothetical protein